MAESSVAKTTRLIATGLEEHAFSYQLTVYLNAEDADQNMNIVQRAKRLIKEDNPNSLILFFISRNIIKGTGEYRPYITFFSHEKFVRTKLIREGEKNECMAISNNRNLDEKRYAGYIRKLRVGRVYDLSVTDFPENFKRFGYLNKRKQLVE